MNLNKYLKSLKNIIKKASVTNGPDFLKLFDEHFLYKQIGRIRLFIRIQIDAVFLHLTNHCYH